MQIDWSPLLQTLECDLDVSAIAFSLDGRLVSGSSGGVVQIWNTVNGALQHTLFEDCCFISSVAFSKDGRVAAAFENEVIRVWNALTGVLQRTIESTGILRKITFSLDSSRLIGGSDLEKVKIWDLATGSLLHALQEPNDRTMKAIAYSADRTRVASVVQLEDIVQVRDIVTGNQHYILRGHTDGILAIEFSPNDDHIATGSMDNTIKIWNALDGTLKHTLEGHTRDVSAVAFSSNGHIISGSHDNTAKLWNLETGTLLHTFEGHATAVTVVAFSHEGLMASGSEIIKLWDVSTNILTKDMEINRKLITRLILSPNGAYAASIADPPFPYAPERGTFDIWDVATGALMHTLHHSFIIFKLVFATDGKQIISVAPDPKNGSDGYDTVVIWDTITGHQDSIMEGNDDISALALSSSNKNLVYNSRHRGIVIWDVRAGTERVLGKYSASDASVLTLSQDDTLIAYGEDNGVVRIYNATTGNVISTYQYPKRLINAMAFSHDGTQLAVASSENLISIHDVNTCGVIHSIKGVSSIKTLSFSHDNQIIETNQGDLFIKAISSPKDEGKNLALTVSVSDAWVLWNGQPLLWVPPEYRQQRMGRIIIVRRDNFLVLTHATGRIVMLKLDPKAIAKLV